MSKIIICIFLIVEVSVLTQALTASETNKLEEQHVNQENYENYFKIEIHESLYDDTLCLIFEKSESPFEIKCFDWRDSSMVLFVNHKPLKLFQKSLRPRVIFKTYPKTKVSYQEVIWKEDFNLHVGDLVYIKWYYKDGHSLTSNYIKISRKIQNTVETTQDKTNNYYIYKYYSSAFGKWLSRGPIVKKGGNNPIKRLNKLDLDEGYTTEWKQINSVNVVPVKGGDFDEPGASITAVLYYRWHSIGTDITHCLKDEIERHITFSLGVSSKMESTIISRIGESLGVVNLTELSEKLSDGFNPSIAISKENLVSLTFYGSSERGESKKYEYWIKENKLLFNFIDKDLPMFDDSGTFSFSWASADFTKTVLQKTCDSQTGTCTFTPADNPVAPPL